MALSDAACRTAKGREGEYKLSDGGGLYLFVKPNGARVWQQTYRFAGRQKKLTHGPYPLISLADARRLRDEAKRLLASGETLEPTNEPTKPPLRHLSRPKTAPSGSLRRSSSTK